MTDNEKHGCGYHGNKLGSTDIPRAVCTFLVVFLILAGITALVLWLVYRPHKPKFTVVVAAIYDLNVSSLPSMISTTMQFTIVMRNPNDRVSIYYDRLSAYVAYKNEAITPQLMLPPLYHEKHSTVALSPVLGASTGGSVPVLPEVGSGVAMDQSYRVLSLRLVLIGKLRWKAGAISTSHYGIYVKCDMLLGFKKGVMGQVPLLGSPICKVDV